MKTVRMTRDFDYHATGQNMVAYKADKTYERVPNAAADAIVAAGAGEVIGDDNGETGTEKSRRASR